MTITCQRKILRTIVTTATKSGLRALPGRTCGGLSAGSPSAPRGGSASPSLLTLERLAGRPWCPPSLLRQSSAFEKERPLRGPCSYRPTAAPLVRNSPRGWTPRSLTTIRWSGRKAVSVVPSSAPAASGTPRRGDKRYLVPSCRSPSSRLCRKLAQLRAMLRALARLPRTSRSGRVFGVHPRGEFRTSERP